MFDGHVFEAKLAFVCYRFNLANRFQSLTFTKITLISAYLEKRFDPRTGYLSRETAFAAKIDQRKNAPSGLINTYNNLNDNVNYKCQLKVYFLSQHIISTVLYHIKI